ncbi:hypothetical protein E4633_14515 [Geomonas terrae]|uniref:TIGR02646 family protein n=1 Tax=Geomonas terrae TaxID=2562681 RepID=A0A4S1CE63_9BACT|nr:hypothetical protein [Geomonas terrae]TGU71523.1 hypothetical protein E4633_14515 [Geomonas terrae]
MIWIDLKHKLPTDADLPADVRWSQADWDAWLAESQQFVAVLAWLDDAGQTKIRNQYIDDHSAHWGKLKPWLKALSGGKCWFSEVKELYSHYDVEHFRPKKEAKELDETIRDGYWWLAFDYMNFRLCGNVGNRKKGGWFPLKNGSLCSTYVNRCEESETAYFIDPIDDNDVSLIAFDEEGKMVPVPGSLQWEQDRVTETAKRLKLNEHVELAEARRKVWKKMDILINDFLNAKSRCGAGNNPAVKGELTQIRARIREMLRPEEELTAVAKWCILLRNNPQLSTLVGL